MTSDKYNIYVLDSSIDFVSKIKYFCSELGLSHSIYSPEDKFSLEEFIVDTTIPDPHIVIVNNLLGMYCGWFLVDELRALYLNAKVVFVTDSDLNDLLKSYKDEWISKIDSYVICPLSEEKFSVIINNLFDNKIDSYRASLSSTLDTCKTCLSKLSLMNDYSANYDKRVSTG